MRHPVIRFSMPPALYPHPLPLSTSPPFFSNHSATTAIYTLSLHDALPIFRKLLAQRLTEPSRSHLDHRRRPWRPYRDRKSTRLNSSHVAISYAVFCLKKKKE